LHAVIGWYHNSLEDDGAANSNDRSTKAAGNHVVSSIGGRPMNGLPLDTLVHEYLELRSSWENREAVKIASRVDEKSTKQDDSQPQVVHKIPPLQPEVKAGGMGRRTAVLVDDASDVVVTVAAFLEAFGFDVIRSSSADHALEILASGTTIELLVTDHAMPGMTGKDLATQACQHHPALRALIITGYPDAEELATLPERVMMLAKPFRRVELREQIRLLFADKPVAEMPAERAKVRVSQD
jgi:CheY-like chemotaxis protein